MTKTSRIRQKLVLTLGLLIVLPGIAAAAPRPPATEDVCTVSRSVVTGNALYTLVFQDVNRGTLQPGRSIALHGIFFTPVRIPVPFHGAAMMSSDGTIRIGIYAFHSARNLYDGNVYTNDKVFSGAADVNFAGRLNVDFNGDAIPEGTLLFEPVDCAMIAIP